MAKKDKKAPVTDKESASEAIYKKFKQNPGIYIGSVVILVLVVVTFLGGDLLSGGVGSESGELTFGHYDNMPISWVQGNMFTQYYERTLSNYQYQAQMQGLTIDDPEIYQRIWRESYEAAVVHTAVLQMLKRSNYKTPEKSVDRSVAQLPQFQDNGRFSPALYNRTPESSRLTLWRQTQDELGKITYFNDFFTGLLVSSGEAEFISRMSTPMRSFEMVSFWIDDYPDSEYLSYGRDNSTLFDSIHMSKITLNSEREAKKILSTIKDGTITFEDAARNQSHDGFADRGGDMGSRYVFELNWEIQNVKDREIILGLKNGEISDVINVGDAWAFYRIERELIPANFDNSAVMERVRMYVRNFARGRMEDWAISQAREFIQDANATSFNAASSRRGLNIRSFGPLPINYGPLELFTGLDSFTIAGFERHHLQEMTRNEDFWKNAFSTPLNIPSEPLVQGSNVLVFLPTEEIEEDEETMGYTSQYYSSSWVNSITERSLHFYFLGHDRMEDRFGETFNRLFR